MTKPRYTAEFKAYVLQEIAKRERPIQAIPAEAKVNRGSLYRWQAAFLASGTPGLERPVAAARRCPEQRGHPLPAIEVRPPSDQRERPRQKVAAPLWQVELRAWNVR